MTDPVKDKPKNKKPDASINSKESKTSLKDYEKVQRADVKKDLSSNSFFIKYKDLLKNNDELIEQVKSVILEVFNQEELKAILLDTTYSGFNAKEVIKKILSILGTCTSKDQITSFFRNLIFLVAVGTTRGTSQKAILKSKNHAKANDIIKFFGVDFPKLGVPFTVQPETITMSRMLTVHPLLAFVVQNVGFAKEKLKNIDYELPNFLASPGLTFMASAFGFRQAHENWYINWYEEVIRIPNKLSSETLIEQHSVGSIANEVILEYNSIFIPIAEKIEFSRKHLEFFKLLFKEFVEETEPPKEEEEERKDDSKAESQENELKEDSDTEIKDGNIKNVKNDEDAFNTPNDGNSSPADFVHQNINKFEKEKELSREVMVSLKRTITSVTGPDFDHTLITRHMNTKQGEDIEHLSNVRKANWDSRNLFGQIEDNVCSNINN